MKISCLNSKGSLSSVNSLQIKSDFSKLSSLWYKLGEHIVLIFAFLADISPLLLSSKAMHCIGSKDNCLRASKYSSGSGFFFFTISPVTIVLNNVSGSFPKQFINNDFTFIKLVDVDIASCILFSRAL